jgi:2,3-diketo-5-methylthio-1-phosphopentane phosphatase
MLPSVLVDFDGTVVLEDTTDLILERFADPSWRIVESAWIEGRIGSRECLAQQIDLVEMSEAELDRLADQATVDPHFVEFTALCRKLGLRTTIGSDGFDRVIARVLARVGVELPVVANRLVSNGHNRWRADFPHLQANCRSQSGNCKCTPFQAEPEPRFLIGDGRSDFCPAAQATMVFAKKALAIHCRKNRIDHIEVAGFREVVRALPAIVARQRRSATRSDEAGLYA